MLPTKSIVFISVLLFISVTCITCENFLKEKKIFERVYPVKLNNGNIFYFPIGSGEPVMSSIGPNHQRCLLPRVSSKITPLGNGKLVFSHDNVGHFEIFDFKNCSSYSLHPIDDGKAYDDMSPYHHGGILETVVAHEDTFDVFDHYQETCMPCRYNDKGEKVQVNHQLAPEPTKDYESYFVEHIKNAFGIEDGYVYGVKFNNFTTVLKVLDSEFKVIKQRVFPRKIAAHSLAYNNFTVCYILNTCLKGRPRNCRYAECQLLDSDLNTVATSKLHQVSDDYDKQNMIDLTVHNLPNGGAMVGMEFKYDWTKVKHPSDVFVQRIQSNGQVEPAIKFGDFKSEFLYMYDFVFNHREYCLATSIDEGRDRGYTIMKCNSLKKLPDN